VEEIEEQLTRLDAGVAALKRVQANLKRYRAAVLKAACEGSLVPTEAALARQEGRRYEPASALLDRFKSQKAEGSESPASGTRRRGAGVTLPRDFRHLPEGWAWTTVNDLALRVQYGHTASAIDRRTGPRFLRITDIQDEHVDWSTVPSCEISDEEKRSYALRPGDIVFARTGATVGKSFMLNGPLPEAVFASYLIRVTPLTQPIATWLWVYFRSPDYWRQVGAAKAGVGQPNVNGEKLRALRVPVPPLAEQYRIVAEVDRRLSLADNLGRIVAASLRHTTRLRQAVLGSFFSPWPAGVLAADSTHER
jgi:type I restriction enzyme S subunit